MFVNKFFSRLQLSVCPQKKIHFKGGVSERALPRKIPFLGIELDWHLRKSATKRQLLSPNGWLTQATKVVIPGLQMIAKAKPVYWVPLN